MITVSKSKEVQGSAAVGEEEDVGGKSTLMVF